MFGFGCELSINSGANGMNIIETMRIERQFKVSGCNRGPTQFQPSSYLSFVKHEGATKFQISIMFDLLNLTWKFIAGNFTCLAIRDLCQSHSVFSIRLVMENILTHINLILNPIHGNTPAGRPRAS